MAIRVKGGRMTTLAQREAAEWREFDHQQRVRERTERLGDVELIRLSDGPPPPDPNAGRTLRITVPGRERITRTERHLIEFVDGCPVYRTEEVSVPLTRERLDVVPTVEGRVTRVRVNRELWIRMPRTWSPDDVLGWMQYAHAIQEARLRDGTPLLALSGLARVVADTIEREGSLINARWIPTSDEVKLADWIAGCWLPWIGHAVERVAVAMTLRGASLRKIGVACGFAPSDTNHTKSVVRKGLWRIGCKLDAMGLDAWPRLAEMKFLLDAEH